MSSGMMSSVGLLRGLPNRIWRWATGDVHVARFPLCVIALLSAVGVVHQAVILGTTNVVSLLLALTYLAGLTYLFLGWVRD